MNQNKNLLPYIIESAQLSDELWCSLSGSDASSEDWFIWSVEEHVGVKSELDDSGMASGQFGCDCGHGQRGISCGV